MTKKRTNELQELFRLASGTNGGRRSAERRIQPMGRPFSFPSPACGRGSGQPRATPTDVATYRRFGRARLSALHRGSRRKPASFTGSTPGHASWDADPAGVTRSHLSQSRDCTSLTGRNAGVTDAQSRPGAGRNPARGHRSRSTFESTLAKGPSVNGMERHVTISVTNVNGKVRPFPEPSLPDLIRQSMRRLGMDHRVIGERKRRRPSNGYARW
jgi:hypothetical protein